MARFAMLTVAILVLAGARGAHGQDADEVKKLKREIELLQRELKIAQAENEQLKKENDRLKAAATGQAVQPTGPGTLADALTEGTTIRGDFKFTTGPKAEGDWALTITNRAGKKFKAAYIAKITRPAVEGMLEVEVEGEVDGDRVKFSSVGTAKVKATFTGELRKDILKLVCYTTPGQASMVAKITK